MKRAIVLVPALAIALVFGLAVARAHADIEAEAALAGHVYICGESPGFTASDAINAAYKNLVKARAESGKKVSDENLVESVQRFQQGAFTHAAQVCTRVAN